MIFAPVLIQVYTRIDHFRRCIESLAQCRGAQETVLYIASDAGEDAAAQEIVDQIRTYCRQLTGFKRVELVAFEHNVGALEAFNQVSEQIFVQYDRIIYTEDDNVFSPNFLEFVNAGLDHYQDDPRVFSVCGYKHPFALPTAYRASTFAAINTAAWGFGLWRDKYLAVDFAPRGDYRRERRTWPRTMPVSWGDLMRDIMEQGRHYGDAAMGYWCLKHGMVNLFPSVSLVRNIGNDGSGMHCGGNDGFATQPIDSGDTHFEFIDDLRLDRRILKRQADAIDHPFIEGWALHRAKCMLRLRRELAKHPRCKAILKLILGK